MPELDTQKDWDLTHWQYQYGKPKDTAIFKQTPEDFIVTEQLGFEPSGEGENVFILIEKREINTQQVCEYLAKFFKKRLRDIGYAGLKDKQSVSQQWFSVQVNVKQDVDLSALKTENIKVIRWARHGKKLKVGTLKANRFRITLKSVSDAQELDAKLTLIQQSGVPNYFGLQRFGIKGNNLNWANRMVLGEDIRNKKIRGFALSAARSYLFNQVISARLASNCYQSYLPGDVFNLSGSNSFFAFDDNEQDYEQRLQSFDINITAPLCGDGESAATGEALNLESRVLEPDSAWLKLLTDHGLKHERRSIRLLPKNMTWQCDPQSTIIEFELPTGCFATSVLRECVNFEGESE